MNKEEEFYTELITNYLSLGNDVEAAKNMIEIYPELHFLSGEDNLYTIEHKLVYKIARRIVANRLNIKDSGGLTLPSAGYESYSELTNLKQKNRVLYNAWLSV